MNNNYVPKFILENNEDFKKINENIKNKKYDELTLNLRNLISLSQEPSDLLDVHYTVISNKKNNAISMKILETELKKSTLFNEVSKVKDNIDNEHKNYLLSMIRNKLKIENKQLRNRIIFIMIPVILIVFLIAYVLSDYYMWFVFLACIFYVGDAIKRIILNKKRIKADFL